MLLMHVGRHELVAHLTFSPDGRALAASGDAALFVWKEIAGGARAERVGGPVYPGLARFSSDGRWLFTGTNDLWRVEVATGRADSLKLWGQYNTKFEALGDVPHVVVSQNLFGARNANLLACWRADDLTPTGKVWEHEFPNLAWYRPLALPDGERFVRLEGALVGVPNSSMQVVTYDAATGARLGATGKVARSAGQALVSPDGRWLAGRDQVNVWLWPLGPDGAAVRVKNDTRRHFTDAAFHPSGRYLAATSNDATVKLYDTTTWELARTFTWNIGRMRSIAFSPDGTLAAAGGDTGKVVVWDVDL